jgi:hypothetical protein
MASTWVGAIHATVAQVRKNLQAAQDRQKKYADLNQRHTQLAVRQQVLLSTKNIALKQAPVSRKLLPKFAVTHRVNDVAYKIDIPDSTRTHNVFHVSLLKPCRSDGRVQPPPPPVEIDGQLEYSVSSILDHRRSTKREYLVSWEGYGPEHSTWEPE